MTLEETPAPANLRDVSADDGVSAELARMRKLVGPDERQYEELRLEIWRLRDEVIGLEKQNARLRSELRDATIGLGAANANAHRAEQRSHLIARSIPYRVGLILTAPARLVRKMLRAITRRR